VIIHQNKYNTFNGELTFIIYVIILLLKATKRLETNNIVMYAQIKYFFCKYL